MKKKNNKFKVGDKVCFQSHVFKAPYVPYYDEYAGHHFEIIALHYGDTHVELRCIDGDVVVKGYVETEDICKAENNH